MIYEIRNYHFDSHRIEDYKRWAREHAVAYLSSELDIVGFWADCGLEPDIRGEPLDSLGPATVTWVIRWDSRDQRQAVLPEVLGSERWKSIFAKVPGGPASYRRVECRFFEAVSP